MQKRAITIIMGSGEAKLFVGLKYDKDGNARNIPSERMATILASMPADRSMKNIMDPETSLKFAKLRKPADRIHSFLATFTEYGLFYLVPSMRCPQQYRLTGIGKMYLAALKNLK